MTRRGRVRAAEPTAAFSPQRKCKTVRFKSHLRNQKEKHPLRVLFFLSVGFEPSDLRRREWAPSATAAGGGRRERDKGENKESRGRSDSAPGTTIFSTGQ